MILQVGNAVGFPANGFSDSSELSQIFSIMYMGGTKKASRCPLKNEKEKPKGHQRPREQLIQNDGMALLGEVS